MSNYFTRLIYLILQNILTIIISSIGNSAIELVIFIIYDGYNNQGGANESNWYH